MELYIEREFLTKFNIEYGPEESSKGKIVLQSILKTYGNINLFTDFDLSTTEKLESFNIIFFNLLSQHFSPEPISSIRNHFFEKSKCDQTLIFTLNQEDWFGDAERKGALCFSYENFESKIEQIITICDNLKVDLSEQFAGWNYFDELKNIPKNKIIINDGYLFNQHSGNLPIDDNLIPLLKSITLPQRDIKIVFHTKAHINNQRPLETVDIQGIKENLKNTLQPEYNLAFEFKQYYFHDRILYSNFFLIDCGVGFNFNILRISNSKITVDSIFDKFNYNRMNNHLKALKRRGLQWTN